MKLTVLCENTTKQKNMIAEHGLSLFLETQRHKVLFDMGQTDAFARNAEQLGIDLSCVDIAVLSHGHYDHGGGIEYFLMCNSSAQIYVSPLAFGSHFNLIGNYIGLDSKWKESSRLSFSRDDLILDEELSIHSCNGHICRFPTSDQGMKIRENGRFFPDSFLHEQYLLIAQSNQKILISGCSHKGVLNIIEWFQPNVFIGGFHFSKWNLQTGDRAALEEVAQRLLRFPTQYYTCHCTGTEQYDFMKRIMGDRLQYISAGESVII